MINNEINSEYVNLVSDDSKGLQLIKLTEAIHIAEETGDDVICINDKCDIPIVRIGDYNKYRYEKAKRDKDNKKKSRLNSQDIKEIQISDVIAEHDLKIKAKHADRILQNGDKVKLVIRYKGRSIRFIADGPDKLRHLASLISVSYKIDKEPNIEGNNVTMILSQSKK